jgi:hypothetical protein
VRLVVCRLYAAVGILCVFGTQTLPGHGRAGQKVPIITRLTARLASFQAQKRHGAPRRRLCGVLVQNAEKKIFAPLGTGVERVVAPGQIANLRCYESLTGRGLTYFDYVNVFSPPDALTWGTGNP